MGVSGSGKTTVGKLLAAKLDFPFFDGDSYHPKANIEKMSKGTPLSDEDRQGWLETLNQLAKNNKNGAVIVCSALKEKYRKILKSGIEDQCEFLFLKGTLEQISQRLGKRQGHFMPKELLQSQFETLEEPLHAVAVSIDQPPEMIVKEVLQSIKSK